MKKAIISFILAATLIMSTAITVFAVDDVGPQVIKKDSTIVAPMRVDDVGPQ
ncbi:MAG: hypothetical protein ACM3TR_05175 [Caulobacteraceae bacterium]